MGNLFAERRITKNNIILLAQPEGFPAHLFGSARRLPSLAFSHSSIPVACIRGHQYVRTNMFEERLRHPPARRSGTRLSGYEPGSPLSKNAEGPHHQVPGIQSNIGTPHPQSCNSTIKRKHTHTHTHCLLFTRVISQQPALSFYILNSILNPIKFHERISLKLLTSRTESITY